MKFSDFICTDAIRPNLEATEREAVIREMVQSLVEAKQLDSGNADDVVQAILEREELGSTAIGFGTAIPHVKHSSVNKIIGTIGICRPGVDFNSLDRLPTRVLFLLITPPDSPTDHLRALQQTASQLQIEKFRNFILQSKTVEDIVEILDEADQSLTTANA
jgi:PTS system fructose-specific IIA component/PTS system nitrogen regulatory IIA component